MTAALRIPLAITAALALTLAACGDDGDPDPGIDAAPDVDASNEPDAAACILPTDLITCTVGDDAPCTAECAGAYCHNFMQLGVVCTNDCATVDDCPAGWSCNNMGRCRPPNP